MEIAVATDVGLVRVRQEDRYLDTEPVLAVADGMGGLARGDFAAATVIECLATISGHQSTAQLRGQIRDAIDHAHDKITRDMRRSLQFGKKTVTGAGSTVAGMAYGYGTAKNAWLVFNVGDSRVYQFDGTLTQLTTDHSVVQEMVETGFITADEAHVHPRRNIVTRAIGTLVSHEPAFKLVEDTGQILIACSDGVSDELTHDQIEKIMHTTPDLEKAAQSIVRAALAAGGHDNATVVIARTMEGQQ